MDIWQGWQVIRRQKFVVLFAAAVSLAMVIVSAQSSVPVYVSTARLIINPPTAVTNRDAMVAINEPGRVSIILLLVTNQEFLERVIKQANLSESWLSLRGRISVKKQEGPGAAIFDVSVVTGDPRLSMTICQAVSTEFTRFVSEFSAKEYASNRRFLEGLVAEAKGNLERCESRIVKWQQENRALDLTARAADYDLTLSRLRREQESYLQKISETKNGINDLKAYADSSQAPPPDLLGERMGELQKALALERLKLARLEETYKSTDPQILQQRAVVAKTQATLQEMTSTAVSGLISQRENNLRDLQDGLKRAKRQQQQLGGKWSLAKSNLDLSRLRREIDMWSQNYQELTTQLYAARIAEQSARREGSVAVIEAAGPGSALGGGLGNMRRTIPMAVPFCLGLGIVVAFLVDYFRSNMRVAPRIQDAMGLPVVGVIPEIPKSLSQQWEILRDKSTGRNGHEDHVELKS